MDLFDRHFDQVEKAHKRMRFWLPLFALCNLAIIGTILGFVGWVIVKLMSYFGVL